MGTLRTLVVVVFLALTLGGCSFLGSKEPELMNWEPALSPDGSTLAYESVVDGHLDLFAKTLSSGEVVRLTENDDEDWSPAWSPDGQYLAFATSRNGNADVFILHMATREARALTADPHDDINPHWGSDGLIYFNSNRSGAWEIYAVSPDGTGLTHLGSPPLDTP
ncbi:MAG: hypothetical protein AB1778_08945 [Candidatus Bipolaricaulota bacterium]